MHSLLPPTFNTLHFRLSDQLASFAEGLDLGVGDEIQVHNIWNV